MTSERSRPTRAAGVTGVAERGSLAEATAAGAGWLPLVVLGVLGGLVLAEGAVLLLAADIARSLGRTTSAVGTALGMWAVGVILGLPFALRAGLGAARLRWATGGAGLICGGVLLVAAAGELSTLVVGAVVAGAGAAISGATHRALLADLYPPLGLTHVVFAYRAVCLAVGAAALAATVPLVTATSLTWRAALLVVVGLGALGVAGLALLDEPVRGGFEASYVRRLADGHAPAPATDRRAGFGESVRRLYAVRSVRPVLLAATLTAAVGYGTVVFGGYALAQRAGLGRDDVAWTLLTAAEVTAAVLLLVAGRFAADLSVAPAGLARRAAGVLALAGAAVAVAGLVPLVPVVVGGVVVAVAALAVTAAAVDRLLLVSVPMELRGAAGALSAGYGGVLGVGLGGSLLAGLEGRVGLPVALCALGGVSVAAGLVLRTVGRIVDADVESAVDSLVERAEATRTQASGRRPPLLTCRRVNFSYGPLQILFDVDFTVDEGEMVALLGTNGAGKSTLLRVVSGLGIPSSGTVRIRGEDVTFAEPGERVKRGVSQIPGGKAVFGPLSVVDNLRLYGYALGRDRRSVDRGIEEAFATFPRLAERRNAPAGTMSGGEQQMLALTKALILKPQLLLIDELSLGLAPVVVGELLSLVRSINAAGTAVVLVEQSVNVALSLAEHAYFMEKGQVRFDGRTADLLERPDILRSVFLSGVAAATSS